MDIVIVATRRHELLERFLHSFSNKVFKYYEIEKVYVNIDPIWGTEADQVETKNVLANYFENIELFEPQEAHFTRAVKTLWMSTKSDLVLHLEEDWIALDDITSDVIEQNLNFENTCLSLMSENKNNTKRFKYHYRRYRPWFLPFKIQDKNKPHFSTSPSFWDGKFLRKCASLMDPNFDPEKQFYMNLNHQLEEFVSSKKCKFLFGNPNLVEDIGREWQQDNKIKKHIKDGVSYWSSN